MKRLILVTMSLLVLLVAGCGSEVSVVIPVPVPIRIFTGPSITHSQYSQDTVNRFVDGSVDFYAPDSDIETITISVVDSGGVLVERTVTSLAGLTGMTTGTISFSIDYLGYRPDSYTFTIYLTDRAGYFSNAVYGSFTV